jgi:hypothetical protein
MARLQQTNLQTNWFVSFVFSILHGKLSSSQSKLLKFSFRTASLSPPSGALTLSAPRFHLLVLALTFVFDCSPDHKGIPSDWKLLMVCVFGLALKLPELPLGLFIRLLKYARVHSDPMVG